MFDYDKNGDKNTPIPFGKGDCTIFRKVMSTEDVVQEFAPALRTSSQAETFRIALQMLGDLCGFGLTYYDFDSSGYVKTATEVSSDNSALMRNIRKHENALTRSLSTISHALLWCARGFGEALPAEGVVTVQYDDSTTTETEEGVETRTCAHDPSHTETRAIPAKGSGDEGEEATLTFDLAGGSLDGQTGTVTVKATVGETIALHGAPAREGYTFKHWKGSQYEASAAYDVEGDHVFTAEWEKDAAPAPSDDSDGQEPAGPSKDDPGKDSSNQGGGNNRGDGSTAGKGGANPASSGKPSPAIPNTAYESYIMVPVSLVAVSLAALIAMIAVRKRKALSR